MNVDEHARTQMARNCAENLALGVHAPLLALGALSFVMINRVDAETAPSGSSINAFWTKRMR